MEKVLVVVDAQNDFLLNDGALNLGHDTKDLRERIADFVGGFEGFVFLTQDAHDEDDPEFKLFPKHCVKNSHGAAICDEILEACETVLGSKFPRLPIQKNAFTTDLVSTVLVNQATPETEFHVVGVCTHICVHDVITGFIYKCRQVKNFTPNIIVHHKLLDDFDEDLSVFALHRLHKLYGVSVI